jgi:hypothetical protein
LALGPLPLGIGAIWVTVIAPFLRFLNSEKNTKNKIKVDQPKEEIILKESFQTV